MSVAAQFHHNLKTYLRQIYFLWNSNNQKKLKRHDIKKWLQGGNSKIHLIILVVFRLAAGNFSAKRPNV